MQLNTLLGKKKIPRTTKLLSGYKRGGGFSCERPITRLNYEILVKKLKAHEL